MTNPCDILNLFMSTRQSNKCPVFICSFGSTCYAFVWHTAYCRNFHKTTKFNITLLIRKKCDALLFVSRKNHTFLLYTCLKLKNLQLTINLKRRVASLEGDNSVVFYYCSASKIWPDKKGDLWLWWEWPCKRRGGYCTQFWLMICCPCKRGLLYTISTYDLLPTTYSIDTKFKLCSKTFRKCKF